MRTSVRFLVFAGVFGLVVGAVYWFLSAEQAGTVLLIMMGAAPLLIAGYLIWRAWNSRLAEDRPDANPEDAAGEPLGHFSTGSLWPFVMAVGVIVGIEGFVYGRWLLYLGVALFAGAVIGLMQESHG